MHEAGMQQFFWMEEKRKRWLKFVIFVQESCA